MSAKYAHPLKKGTMMVYCLLLLAGCTTSYALLDSIRPVFRSDGEATQIQETSHYTKGKQMFAMGSYGLALESFHKAAAQKPNSVRALNGIAACYDQIHRYDMANSYYFKALKIQPDSVKTLNNLAYSYILQERFADAEKVLGSILASDPANAHAKHNLELAQNRMIEAVAVEAVAPEAVTVEAVAPEAVTVEAVAPEAVTVEAVTPEAVTVEAVAPEAVTVEAVAPEAVTVEAVAPEAVTVEAVAPEAVTVEAVAPEAVTVEAVAPEAVAVEAVTPEAVAVEAVTPEAAAETVVTEATNKVTAIETQELRVITLSVGNRIEVVNGNGRNGMAKALSNFLKSQHEWVWRISNALPFNQEKTTLYYASGKQIEAEQLAIKVPASIMLKESISNNSESDLRLVIGHDFSFNSEDEIYLAAKTDIKASNTFVQSNYVLMPARLEIANGNGGEGVARLMSNILTISGEKVARVTNAANFNHPTSVIFYMPNRRQDAERVAAMLPVNVEMKEMDITHRRVDIRIVIGKDLLEQQEYLNQTLTLGHV